MIFHVTISTMDGWDGDVEVPLDASGDVTAERLETHIEAMLDSAREDEPIPVVWRAEGEHDGWEHTASGQFALNPVEPHCTTMTGHTWHRPDWMTDGQRMTPSPSTLGHVTHYACRRCNTVLSVDDAICRNPRLWICGRRYSTRAAKGWPEVDDA